MKQMEKYLLELIKTHNRIIIPNFGALIISREKGLNILFNNFLTFNDGILINHVSVVEGIDPAVATDRVVDFARSIQASLGSSGKHYIPGVGTFMTDENGILRFEQDEPAIPQASPEAPTSPATSPSATLASGLLDLDPILEDTKLPAPSPRQVEAKEPARPRVAKDANTGKQPAAPHKSPAPAKPAANPAPPVKNEPAATAPSRGSRTTWPYAIIFIILLVVAGGYLWFFTNLLDDLKGVAAPPPVEPVEEVIPAPAPADTIIQQAQEVNLAPVPTGVRQHHIILGSFNDEGLASRMVESLIGKGVANAAILPHEGRFLVSAEWHTSVRTAYQRQEELLNELQMENWILSVNAR